MITHNIPIEYRGYKVIKLKSDPESVVVHYLYIKEHAVREICKEKPADRTLFILGTPPFITEQNYKCLFSCFGTVENVYFHSAACSTAPAENESAFFVDIPKVMGYKVAYVVFAEQCSVHSVMNCNAEQEFILSSKDNPVVSGISKWCTVYNSKLMDVEALQRDIDRFMAEHDNAQQLQLIQEKQQMQADAEGWTKVTTRGRRPGFARKESVHDRIMKKENEKKQKKQLLNFYRFQIRESKLNQLVTLREKFEEDKKKIALLKQSRKFRPF